MILGLKITCSSRLRWLLRDAVLSGMFIVIALTMSRVCQAQNHISAEDQAKYAKEYDALMATLIEGDLSKVDFQEFRVAGVMRGGADGSVREFGERTRYRQLIKAGNPDEAYQSVADALKRNFASAPNHYNAWEVCQALKKDVEASLHEKILAALLDSIASHGDCKTAEIAYLAVTTPEEYLFMTFRLHLSVKGQSLVNQAGHTYDRMEYVSDKGEHGFMWFLIDVQMGNGFAAGSAGNATPTVIATATPGSQQGILEYKLDTQGRPWNGSQIAVTRTKVGSKYHFVVNVTLPVQDAVAPSGIDRYDVVTIYGFRLVDGKQAPGTHDSRLPLRGHWVPGDVVKLEFNVIEEDSDAAQGWHMHLCAGKEGRCLPSPNLLEMPGQ